MSLKNWIFSKAKQEERETRTITVIKPITPRMTLKESEDLWDAHHKYMSQQMAHELGEY